MTIHNEDDVRINSLLDEETLWFSRVKCFPLYTIMLAVNRVEYDLLSLGVHGQELDVSFYFFDLGAKVANYSEYLVVIFVFDS